ncbi:MAG: peptidylprolyl isomerase [Bacillota bacterium]
MFKKSIIIMTLLTLLFTIPTMATEGDSDTQSTKEEIAAVVNGEEISITELDQYANMQQLIMQLYQSNQQFTQLLLQSEAGQNLMNEYRKTKLDGLITSELLKMEAKNRNIELNEEEKDQMFNQQLENIKSSNNMSEEQLLSNLSQQGISSLDEYKKVFLESNNENLLVNKLMQEVTSDINISDERAEEYYNNNKSQFEHQKQVNASHILVNDEETANEVIENINNGEDFAELAKEYSEGPSASDGGKIGFFQKGDMVAPFEEKAFDMEVGEITDEAVKTEYGYHVIKINDTKEAGTASFEEVKGSIKENLANNEKQNIWDQFVRELRDESEIEKKLD